MPDCRLFGPAALDNALFPAAAKYKGMDSRETPVQPIALALVLSAYDETPKDTCNAKGRPVDFSDLPMGNYWYGLSSR